MHDKYINFISEACSLGAIKGIKTDGKGALAIACHDLCSEHVRSIGHLLNLGAHASALALLRPSVEAFVRGLWVEDCIELSQVEMLSKSHGSWPKFGKMAEQVNSKLNESDFLSRYSGKEYGLLNNFTHGSGYQILSRFDGKTMNLTLSNEELLGVYTELALLSFGSNYCIA